MKSEKLLPYSRTFAVKWTMANHKLRMNRTVTRVDVSPPKILAGGFLRLRGLKGDFFALKRIMGENIQLLTAINQIAKSHNLPQYHNRVVRMSTTKLKNTLNHIHDLEKQNLLMGCRLQAVKPFMRREKSIKHYKQNQLAIRRMTNLSHDKMERVRIAIPRYDARMLDKLLHPKIFLDLDVKNIRPLGRIIIQLFTEACPEVVLEFVRLGTYNKTDLLNFIRIFPNLWIEGELNMKNEILAQPNFEHNMSIVTHDVGPGILSFGQSFMQEGFPYGLLNFSISFKPMNVPNGIRCAFGVVKNGTRVIDCLQDYGTKNGKTKKEIVCVRAGLIT